MIGESILQLHEGNAVDESILKSDEYDEYQPITGSLMHLYSSMKLTLAGQMVEHVNYPGQATSLLGLASYSPDYSKGCGLIEGWTPGITANAAVANTG